MSNKFKVLPNEIPNKITIFLSEEEKCIFARLLTRFGFGVDVAGDTFQHLYRRGLNKIYEEYESNKQGLALQQNKPKLINHNCKRNNQANLIRYQKDWGSWCIITADEMIRATEIKFCPFCGERLV